MPYTQVDADTLRAALAPHAPVVSVSLSTLGGADRASLLIFLSPVPRDQWANGVRENAPHAHLSLDHRGSLEHFGGYGMGKLRLSRGNTVAKAVERIAAFLAKAKEAAKAAG